MYTRRKFIKHTLLTGAATAGLGSLPMQLLAQRREVVKISFLHTNDMHSHIEPFPLNDPKYPGLGGMARRARLIRQIRQNEEHVLLFDAGDIFQGTPYFNYYGGELEFKLMNYMKYNACTLGNHDFDNGIEHLAGMMDQAKFPFICSNYDFSNTPLHGKTAQFITFEIEGIKIGVFGLGIKLNGLVEKKLFGEARYLDPVEQSAKISYWLRKDLGCHFIVCISHLGFQYKSRKICDASLAQHSMYIDLIIGGHSHLFLDKPAEYRNKKNQPVLVAQAGWAGIALGKLDYFFERQNAKKIGCHADFFHLSKHGN